MPRRWLWFWLLLAVSVGITVVGTIVFHNPLLALFLFLPFGPWMFRRRASDDAPPRAVCPRCGRPARASDDRFCPHDGEPLPRP